MADFTPPRCPHAAGFTDRIGREIIVQHEVLFAGAFEAVDKLFILAGTQRCDHQSLRFTAGEQRRTMGARQRTDFGHDGAHGFEIAPVDAPPGVEHRIAHHIGFEIVEQIAKLVGGKFALALAHKLFRRLGADFGDAVAAEMLFGDMKCRCEIGTAGGFQGFQQRRGFIDRNAARFLGGAFGQTDDRVDHRLHALVAEHHGAEHHLLRQFFRFGFDHQHRIGRARHHEIERGIGHIVDRRIEAVFPVDIANAGSPDGPEERDARKGQCRGRGHQRHHIGIAFQIMAQHLSHHLRFVAIALGEERADRPVDQARDQGFAFGRRAFALEIAAGNLAGRIIAFLVIHGEGEEIHAFARGGGADYGGQHNRLAISHQNGAVSLTRHLSGFEGERAPAPFNRFTMDIEHLVVLHFPPPDCGRATNRLSSDKQTHAQGPAFLPASLAAQTIHSEAETPSAPQPQPCNEAFVTLLVTGLHIIEQTAALGHELDQAAARMIVLRVGLEMLGQIGDALGQDGDLHIGRARIARLGRIFGNQFLFAFGGNRHLTVIRLLG